MGSDEQKKDGSGGGSKVRSLPVPSSTASIEPTVEIPVTDLNTAAGAGSGSQYWRSLDELADTPEFQKWLHREFPANASEFKDPKGRRSFLKLMGASLALAGFAACTRQPEEKIVPYVRQPEEMVPGEPLFFATAMTLGGYATGILVESHEGRPTKIEGNPLHPASLGSVDAISLASILNLYDPDRPQTVTNAGDISTWTAFVAAMRVALDGQRPRQGAGLRILTETVTSPTLASQIRALLAEFPNARWHQYEPVNLDNVRAGAKLAFGEYVNTVYRFDKADVILSLDSDFLGGGPGSLRYARDYASRRRIGEGNGEMNRLYVVECTPTITGAAADHRLAIAPSEVLGLARSIAEQTGVPLSVLGPAKPVDDKHVEWVAAVARDMKKHSGSGLVVAGRHQPPIIHLLAHAINETLGNTDKTLIHTDPIEASPVDQMDSLVQLVQEMDAGRVEALVMIGGNPVYTAPADLKFGDRLAKVLLRAHLSERYDETSELCHWHIPGTHYLESWSDARAYDGTTTIIQPLIAPLYQSKSAHELLAALMNQPERSAYDIVREIWRARFASGQIAAPAAGKTDPLAAGAGTGAARRVDTGRGQPAPAQPPATIPAQNLAEYEAWWRRSLHDGVVAGTVLPPKQVTVNSDEPASMTMPTRRSGAPPLSSPRREALVEAFSKRIDISPVEPGSIETIFRPDPSIYDGRFANNGWLQELPRPLTKLTWDNAALISPATAQRFGLANEDVVELHYDGRMVETPIWILPGQTDNCVTVNLGYGRTRAGRVGNGAGFNAYALRTSGSPWSGTGLEIRKTGRRRELACTQLHHNLEGRDLLRSGTLDEYRKDPTLAPEGSHESGEHPSLYPKHEYPGHAWGMAIDLNACIGCNACMVACQSENNIPVVGREQVVRGREMHWIRVDRYYKGTSDQPEAYFQPLPCMHCENAPCEVVCPVGATVHSAEGLNDMVYNRCVGTRYCLNNCPYKVRRFNFLLYQDWETPTLKMMRNPDVSVRSRGVMEKCTYCVQRINRAKITSEKEDRSVRDGEIVTACEAACPTTAITFGDINDPNSRVSKLRAEHRNYSLLGELNTNPRTTYLGAVRNPNPELKS
jgi:molybdopterin-containing oxidoreductase family iron-sulfur binding subunit